MSPTLRECLKDLEARIDPQQEDRLHQQWIDFSQGRFQGQVFSPTRPHPTPPSVEWPEVSVNAALADYEAMALQQYGACSEQLTQGSGAMMNVRCNYGTSIIPLLYGVEPFVMDEALNTLPTSRPLNDADAVQRIVDAGVPALRGGYAERVFEMAARYTQIAREYPKIGRYVHIYHPDLQGPMDICEVVWGSTIFYAMYDQPKLVHALLEVVTQTYLRFMRAWVEVVPFEAQGNAHWGYFHRGNIMLRDDSAMNLSPDMFDAFVRPYDQRLLDAFGGGAIHFCGKGDHYADRLPGMPGVYAVHMSQPQYNDMTRMLAHTADAGINLLGLEPDVARDIVASGRDLRGRVHSYLN
jgi:hypothetical protein